MLPLAALVLHAASALGPCHPIDAPCLSGLSMEPAGPAMEVVDPRYLALIAGGLQVVPDLIDLVADPTETEQTVPLFRGRWSVGDIAHSAISDIVPQMSWLEFVTGRSDPENDHRYLTCGYCAYWEYVRESPEHRRILREKARVWFDAHRERLHWKPEPGLPRSGAYVFDEVATGAASERATVVVDLDPEAVIENGVDLRRFHVVPGGKVVVSDLELGDSIEGATVELLGKGPPPAAWRVQVQFETSVTIQDEGPHLDLTDWKHYTSEWRDVAPISPTHFQVPTFTEEEETRFPKVELEDLRAAVAAASDEGWVEHIREVHDVNDYPAEVGISVIRLRVLDATGAAFVIEFSIPMGC